MTVLNTLVLGVAVLLIVESSLAFSPSALLCRFDAKLSSLRTVTEYFCMNIFRWLIEVNTKTSAGRLLHAFAA